MQAGVHHVVEVAAVFGPELHLGDGALDLAAGDRHRAAHLGNQHPTQVLLVTFQRVVQLGQAVEPEVDVARPVRLVERPPGRTDGAGHVLDGAVGGLARDLFAGRMDDVEGCAAGGVLQFAVDQHALVAGQHAGFALNRGHRPSFTDSS